MGTGFYGSNDPTNSVKALKEDVLRSSNDHGQCVNAMDLQKNERLQTLFMHVLRTAVSFEKKRSASAVVTRMVASSWSNNDRFGQ